MNLLLTDGNYKHTLGIARDLGQEGHRVFVQTPKKGSLTSRSRFCAGEVVVQLTSEKMDSLLSFISEKQIEAIIPVGADSVQFVAQHRDQLQGRVEFAVPFIDSIQTALSKELTNQTAQQVGVPIPWTHYPADLDEVGRLAREISYPCVVKAKQEMGINVVAYAHDPEDLVKKYARIMETHGFSAPELPLIQEYLTGDGVGFFAIYQRGSCGPTFQHHRLREFPPSGGVSVYSESFYDERVERYGKQMLDALNWHGVAMVEFKLNKAGEPLLLEINPKFWGSTELALSSGVHFPRLLVNLFHGKTLDFSSTYKLNHRYHWPLHGDLLHGVINMRNLPKVIGTVLNPRTKSNIWLTDLKPTLGMLKQSLIQAKDYFIKP